MSTSLTVVVEKQSAGQDLYLLPHVWGGLDGLATRLGLALPSSFQWEDPALLAEIADDLDEETREKLTRKIEGQQQWHNASAGLATVEGLLEHLRKADPEDLSTYFGEAEEELVVRAILQEEDRTLAEAVQKELEDCAKQLGNAVGKGRRFRFDMG
jgi:hypothetical protein